MTAELHSVTGESLRVFRGTHLVIWRSRLLRVIYLNQIDYLMCTYARNRGADAMAWISRYSQYLCACTGNADRNGDGAVCVCVCVMYDDCCRNTEIN